MRDSAKLNLGGLEVEVPRARLGLYLRLAQAHTTISEAVKAKDIGACAVSIREYMGLVIPLSTVDLTHLSGVELLSAYVELSELNSYAIDIPMTKARIVEKQKDSSWDYAGRVLVLWVHIIASAYGWALTEIHSLWPEDAAAYIEEILVDDQLKREWEYSLSTLAYKYDKKGKGTLIPLSRPGWMRRSGEPRTTRIPRRLIPMGTIIDLSGVPQGGSHGSS